MVKDRIFRLLFIPLLGMIIPFLSNIITYRIYSPLELIGIFIYFIFVSWSIWTSAVWLLHKIRTWFPVGQNTFIKISSISLTNAFFGGTIAAILVLIWYKISKETFYWTYYFLSILIPALSVILFTLIYEILYLSKERELDTQIVGQLDWERSVAQMSNLKNELEPHFIFNSLNTLSHLILTNQDTAFDFNRKLASVYKYFLVNKDRDMISLREEIEFIESYFFLIQLRYDNQLNLSSKLDDQEIGKLMIMPFALQVAVENAIKHNAFTVQEPLYISIELGDNIVLIRNNKKLKINQENSTGIGLKNLRSRYQIFCKKDIVIEDNAHEYILKLPLIFQNA